MGFDIWKYLNGGTFKTDSLISSLSILTPRFTLIFHLMHVELVLDSWNVVHMNEVQIAFYKPVRKMV